MSISRTVSPSRTRSVSGAAGAAVCSGTAENCGASGGCVASNRRSCPSIQAREKHIASERSAAQMLPRMEHPSVSS